MAQDGGGGIGKEPLVVDNENLGTRFSSRFSRFPRSIDLGGISGPPISKANWGTGCLHYRISAPEPNWPVFALFASPELSKGRSIITMVPLLPGSVLLDIDM
jgi:hypothetical protein